MTIGQKILVMFMWFMECKFLETKFVTFKNQSFNINRMAVISNTYYIIFPISVVVSFFLDFAMLCSSFLSLEFSMSVDPRIC